MKVRWTGHLTHSGCFLPLRLSEVHWKSVGHPSDWTLNTFWLFSASKTVGSPTDVRRTGQSDAFLLQDDFTGLGPDWGRTSTGLWSIPTDSDGRPTDCPAESVGIGWVRSKSVGLRRTTRGSVKYTQFVLLGAQEWCRFAHKGRCAEWVRCKEAEHGVWEGSGSASKQAFKARETDAYLAFLS